MIEFCPPDLKNEISSMLDCFSFLDGDIDEISFSDIVSNPQEYDAQITENAIVCLHIGEDTYPTTTLKYLLSLYQNWKEAKINKPQSYARSPYEVDYLLTVSDYDTRMLLDGLERSTNPVVVKDEKGVYFWSSTVQTENGIYRVCLFNGLCLYHLKVEESGNFDKYFPSYFCDDYFVQITCDSKIDMSLADSLAVSFAFELQATHNIQLNFSKGRPDPNDIYYDDSELSSKTLEIFPLIHGRGIQNLLELYNGAKNAYDIDYKILSFTKVIEYVAPTIANSNLNDRILLKLKSPTVLHPTSSFVDELGELFRKHQSDISKDSELIRLSVEKTITLSDIWNYLPAFIRPAKYSKIDDVDEANQSAIIGTVCEAIYDTRNEIAHAKANYTKKGKECPYDQKSVFVELLDFIAVRCIRWFALQPEDKRMI